MSSTKGDRWERHYRNALCADADDVDAVDRVGIEHTDFVLQFTAVRMPSSGAGTVEDLPDLHVWLKADPDEVAQYAAEVKAGRDRVRLTNEEVKALRRYGEATGATPIVFVHIDYVGDFVVPIDDLHSTDKGYTFTKARDADHALSFNEWVKRPTTSV